MTGGQPIDGTLTVPMIVKQLYSEGITEIVVVTEEPDRYHKNNIFDIDTDIVHRDLLNVTQERLKNVKGVSVLIFDQTCAAEKRRRRKTGELPQLNKRLFINTDVCEGCGDCGLQSNCTSLLPHETKLGRKRKIDQSSCNQDYSCIKGFCPSFVAIEGGTPKDPTVKLGNSVQIPEIPAPNIPELNDNPFNIFITGIGGTGVITVGALLGMAAHLEGKSVSVLDMTGMSQKNGAVTSHVRITERDHEIRAQRIATGEADLLLSCDMLTAGGQDAISKTRVGRTIAIINTHNQPTGAFAQDRDWSFPDATLRKLIKESVENQATFINATQIVTRLLGDSIATNLFMLGLAFQKGKIPLVESSILKAIELNGVAVDANKKAFQWGRYTAIDEETVMKIAVPEHTKQTAGLESLNEIIEDRMHRLTQYQDKKYADRYKWQITRTKKRIESKTKSQDLCVRFAKNLFRLMAYKDEYEVARMYTDPAFMESLDKSFDGKFKIRFNLAPPLISKRDVKGHLIKSTYGSWMMYPLRLIAKLRFLRGTPFDLFGKTEERIKERQLIKDYILAVEQSLTNQSPLNESAVRDLIELPSEVRGFGHVKLTAIENFYTKLNQFHKTSSEVTWEQNAESKIT